MNRVRNDLFDSHRGYERGRGWLVFAMWQLCKWLFFRTIFPWPSWVKVVWLRGFGARVGEGVYLKPQVNIHLPWKLKIGAHAWIGEEVFLLNLEPIEIGAHACVSQRAFLCTGNHDYRDPAMSYRNAPIWIGAGAWIGAQTFVGPGVRVGEEAVVPAGSVVTRDVPGGVVWMRAPEGVPADLADLAACKPRFRESESGPGADA